MKYHKIAVFAAAILSGLLGTTGYAQNTWKKVQTVRLNDVSQESSRYRALYENCKSLLSGRYMEQSQVPGYPKSVKREDLPPGWSQDDRMKEFRYQVKDKDGSRIVKEGWVILFDAEPERMAAWIANAVIETSRGQQSYSADKAAGLVDLIQDASGSQFPVVGTVWEDQYKANGEPPGKHEKTDGVNEAYGFLDGITVKGKPDSFYWRRPSGARARAIKPLGAPALEAAMKLRWGGGAVPGDYARIASTELDRINALRAKLGESQITEDQFPEYVRKTYQAAMKGTRNELLVARILP